MTAFGNFEVLPCADLTRWRGALLFSVAYAQLCFDCLPYFFYCLGVRCIWAKFHALITICTILPISCASGPGYKPRYFLFILTYHLKFLNLTPCITKRIHMWNYHLAFFLWNFTEDFFLLWVYSMKGTALRKEPHNLMKQYWKDFQRHLMTFSQWFAYSTPIFTSLKTTKLEAMTKYQIFKTSILPKFVSEHL